MALARALTLHLGRCPGWDERTPLASGSRGNDSQSGMGLRRAPKAHPHSSLRQRPRKPAPPAPALKSATHPPGQEAQLPQQWCVPKPSASERGVKSLACPAAARRCRQLAMWCSRINAISRSSVARFPHDQTRAMISLRSAVVFTSGMLRRTRAQCAFDAGSLICSVGSVSHDATISL